MEREDFKNHIDVSIIIVSYNSFQLLVNCLNALISFTANIKYEIIVIDNNSSEGNISDLLSGYKDLILIKNSENKGFGAANNQGLSLAKGKYVLLLNSDTIFIENSLKKVYDFAESLSSDLIIGCRLLNEDKSLQHSVYDYPTFLNVFTSNFFLYALFPRSRFFSKYYLMNRKTNEIKKVDVVTGAFLFGSRKLLIEIGGFDERFFFYNEETDLCYRFKQAGGNIYYFPGTEIIHLKGGTANKQSWFAYKYQSESTVKFFQKHFKGVTFISTIVIHYVGIIIRIPIFFILGVITLNQNLITRSLYYLRLPFIYPRNIFKEK